MPQDINDPYRLILGDDEDPWAEKLFGPRKLDQYSAVEREDRERARQAAIRAQQEPEQEPGGMYRAPFERGEDELLTDYGFRLYQALTDRNRSQLTTCVVNKTQFRIKNSATAPLFCSDNCYQRAIRADEKEFRKRKR